MNCPLREEWMHAWSGLVAARLRAGGRVTEVRGSWVLRSVVCVILLRRKEKYCRVHHYSRRRKKNKKWNPITLLPKTFWIKKSNLVSNEYCQDQKELLIVPVKYSQLTSTSVCTTSFPQLLFAIKDVTQDLLQTVRCGWGRMNVHKQDLFIMNEWSYPNPNPNRQT